MDLPQFTQPSDHLLKERDLKWSEDVNKQKTD